MTNGYKFIWGLTPLLRMRVFTMWICLGILSVAACENNGAGRKTVEPFEIKILSWTDSSGQLSSQELQNELMSSVVSGLPPLKGAGMPILFVRGSLRADEKGSVMILESRYLFSESNVPVKVIIMGSIEGDSLHKQQKLVKGVLKDLRFGLTSNIRICNGNSQTWIAALNSPEADEQILALDLLRIHGEKQAAPKVISLLDDPRSEVGTAATETATVLADATHAKKIINIASKGGIEVEARCVQVLSRIGGAEAVAYLEMLAVGHENPQLRELSFNALKRLK